MMCIYIFTKTKVSPFPLWQAFCITQYIYIHTTFISFYTTFIPLYTPFISLYSCFIYYLPNLDIADIDFFFTVPTMFIKSSYFDTYSHNSDIHTVTGKEGPQIIFYFMIKIANRYPRNQLGFLSWGSLYICLVDVLGLVEVIHTHPE